MGIFLGHPAGANALRRHLRLMKSCRHSSFDIGCIRNNRLLLPRLRVHVRGSRPNFLPRSVFDESRATPRGFITRTA